MGSLNVISPMVFYPGCPATFGGKLINKLYISYCSKVFLFPSNSLGELQCSAETLATLANVSEVCKPTNCSDFFL